MHPVPTLNDLYRPLAGLRPWALGLLGAISFGLPVAPAGAQPTSGLHYSPAELAVWRTRMTSGPYRSMGDAGHGANTPPDGVRIATFADEFRAQPMLAGNTAATNLSLWTGYPIGNPAGDGDYYPVWQGVKMAAAGFRYLLTGDTSYGNPVRRTLLAQMEIPGTQVGDWPVTTNYEAGAKEAVWLTRLLFAYDYTRDLYTPAEHQQIADWFRPAAYYFVNRVQAGPIGQCFPQRLLNNYTVRSRDAAPGGVPQWSSPIYATTSGIRDFNGDGFLRTHVNADGSMGNRIPRTALHYNNRVSERVSFAGQCGLAFGDTLLVHHARQFAREWLMFSIFPDGTMGEYERNGDYNNPSQGKHYGAINLQQYLLLADALARRGDASLYEFKTAVGAHGTQCSPGTTKSIYTVLERYGRNITGVQPIFFRTPTLVNRIDNQVEGGVHAPWDYLFSIANKYYRSSYLTSLYRRSAPGSIPVPSTQIASAAMVWVSWGGTGAELPGVLLMNGGLENLNVYPLTCPSVTGLTVSQIEATTARVAWTDGRAALGYRLRFRRSGTTTWTTVTPTGNSHELTGLSPLTEYDIEVEARCGAGTSSGFTAQRTFTTAPLSCPGPTGISLTAPTPTAILVSAQAGANTLDHTIEYRLQGATDWMTLTGIPSLPHTINGVQGGATYQVRMQARCATGTSTMTAAQTVTTPHPPCPSVTQMRGGQTAVDSARFSWQPANGAQRYTLRLRATGSSNWKIVNLTSTSHREGALQPGTQYEYQVNTQCPNNQQSGFTASERVTLRRRCALPTQVAGQSPQMGQIQLSWQRDSALSTGLRYRTSGSAQWTTLMTAQSPTTLTGLPAQSQVIVEFRGQCLFDSTSWGGSTQVTVQALPCLAPGTLTLTTARETSLTVAIPAPTTPAPTYRVRYRSTAAGPTASWTEVTTSQTSLTIGSLAPATEYELEARSECSPTLSSPYSSRLLARTHSLGCGAPVGLQASAGQRDTARIEWGGVSQAFIYRVRYRREGTPAWDSTGTSQTRLTLTGLLGGTTYQIQVRTLCGTGAISGYSPQIRYAHPQTIVPTSVGGRAMAGAWQIYPQPTEGQGALTLTGPTFNGPLTLRLFTMAGQLLYQQSVPLALQGGEGLPLPLALSQSMTAAGVYLLEVYVRGQPAGPQRQVMRIVRR